MIDEDIGFIAELKCDRCDSIGVYSVRGEALCVFCLNECIDTNELLEEDDHGESEDCPQVQGT